MSVVERVIAKAMEKLEVARERDLSNSEAYQKRKAAWEALSDEERKRRVATMIRKRRYKEKVQKKQDRLKKIASIAKEKTK